MADRQELALVKAAAIIFQHISLTKLFCIKFNKSAIYLHTYDPARLLL